MEEKRVKVNNKKPGIAVLACLFMLTAIFCIGLAGNCREVKAESGTEKIMFQDNSGRYLKKSGANWCLRDVKTKRLQDCSIWQFRKQIFCTVAFTCLTATDV